MIKVKGLEGVQKQLEQISAETQVKVLRSAAREAFKPVLEAAQAKVPEDTGALRASLTLATATRGTWVAGGIVVTNKSAGLKQARVAAAAFNEAQGDDAPARRWHLTELGTSHSPAQPFLRPALDENAEKVSSQFAESLNKKIKKALKGGSR